MHPEHNQCVADHGVSADPLLRIGFSSPSRPILQEAAVRGAIDLIEVQRVGGNPGMALVRRSRLRPMALV